MEDKKDVLMFFILFTPLFLIIAFGLSYTSKAPQKVIYMLFLIAGITAIAGNIVMIQERKYYESNAIMDAVYTFAFVLISTYKIFNMPARQALYSYKALAAAAVAFGFFLYFLIQIKLHPKVKG